jgi:hypothetical protein
MFGPPPRPAVPPLTVVGSYHGPERYVPKVVAPGALAEVGDRFVCAVPAAAFVKL